MGSKAQQDRHIALIHEQTEESLPACCMCAAVLLTWLLVAERHDYSEVIFYLSSLQSFVCHSFKQGIKEQPWRAGSDYDLIVNIQCALLSIWCLTMSS